MIHRLALVLSAFLAATGALAQASETASTDVAALPVQTSENVVLEELLWLRRPLVIFADSELDPRFSKQMELLNALPHELIERDVLVVVDTDPAAKSDLRQKLRPRGFMMVLIGKDGLVYLRKPTPWSVREISASIDKLPLRQQEIRDSHSR